VRTSCTYDFVFVQAIEKECIMKPLWSAKCVQRGFRSQIHPAEQLIYLFEGTRFNAEANTMIF
jgi:hypothetical protein